jgi:hypothetical protein
MGWTASYQLLRETPLSSDEIAAIAILNQEASTEPWQGESFSVAVAPGAREDRVIVSGWNKFPLGESEDPERLEGVLQRLRELVPGAELRVIDDFGYFKERGKRQPEWIDVPSAELVDPASLAPPPPMPLPAAVVDLVAAERAGQAPVVSDAQQIDALFMALTKINPSDPRCTSIECLLGRAPAQLVSQVGLESYMDLSTYYHARAVLERALCRAEDLPALCEPFLEAWLRPEGVYYYGDMPLPDRFRDAMAAEPEVVAQMSADLNRIEQRLEEEVTYRCAEHAAAFLARGRTDAGLHALVSFVRRWRDCPRPWRLDVGAFSAAHEHLAYHGDARAFATLLAYVGSMRSDSRCVRAALSALVRIDPARASSYLLAMARAEVIFPTAIARELPLLGLAITRADEQTEVILQLRRLSGYPAPEVRRLAREGLELLDVPVNPEDDAQPPPEQLILHPDREVRREAMYTLHARKDVSLFLSLAAAESVDAHLRERLGDSCLPFTWYGWDERLPKDFLRVRSAGAFAWAQEHAAQLFGPQKILPAISPVLSAGPAAVAVTYPSQLFRLPSAELASLDLEEAAMLASLAG